MVVLVPSSYYESSGYLIHPILRATIAVPAIELLQRNVTRKIEKKYICKGYFSWYAGLMTAEEAHVSVLFIQISYESHLEKKFIYLF